MYTLSNSYVRFNACIAEHVIEMPNLSRYWPPVSFVRLAVSYSMLAVSSREMSPCVHVAYKGNKVNISSNSSPYQIPQYTCLMSMQAPDSQNSYFGKGDSLLPSSPTEKKHAINVNEHGHYKAHFSHIIKHILLSQLYHDQNV